MVLSAIISLMLPNYYTATTVFYPASSDLSSPQPLGYVDKNIRYFGNDHDRDRVFSISQSVDIADEIIEKYDLITRYDIDTSHQHWQHFVRSTFYSYYNIIKTKYDALELSFESTDPQMSADIANEARDLIAQHSDQLTKSSQQNQLATFEQSIVDKEKFLQSMNDSVVALRKTYGVFDLKVQSEILMSELTDVESNLAITNAKLKTLTGNAAYRDSIPYYKANQAGYESQQRTLQTKLDKYSKGYRKVYNLNDEINQVSRQLSIDKERVKQLQSSFRQNALSLHVIQEAKTPIIKSRPRRSFYVLASGLFAFGLSCIFVLILHSYKAISWKEILRDE